VSIVCLTNVDIDCNVSYAYCRAQLLFEDRLALNPGLNLTRVSFSFVLKHFLAQFSLVFIGHRIINNNNNNNNNNTLFLKRVARNSYRN